MAKKQVMQVVESKSDTHTIKALREKIKELERVVGQKQLLIEFKDKMIEIAESTYNVDIKKKSVPNYPLVLHQQTNSQKEDEQFV